MQKPSAAFRAVAVLGLVAAALGAGACQAAVEADPEPEPAAIRAIEGSDLHEITLTARAAERLGIETVPAAAGSGGTVVIPYSAIIYDAEGGAWVYVSPADLMYLRHFVEVEEIRGEEATLSSGPDVGTAVVAVGVAELFGTEFEVGH